MFPIDAEILLRICSRSDVMQLLTGLDPCTRCDHEDFGSSSAMPSKKPGIDLEHADPLSKKDGMAMLSKDVSHDAGPGFINAVEVGMIQKPTDPVANRSFAVLSFGIDFLGQRSIRNGNPAGILFLGAS